MARLSREGYVLVAITNQPDIARGNVESSVIHEQNRRLMDALPIDAIYMCPHDGTDECACRKPQPGMLAQAARELDLDLANSWLIGDRWVDLAAASAAGVAAVLLARAWSWEATSAGEPPENLRRVPTADSLAACIDLILAGSDSPAGA